MKICPQCKAANKDSNRFCIDCSQYLSNIESVDDRLSFQKSYAKANRSSVIRKVIAYTIFVLIYGSYNIFMANICYLSHGNYDIYLSVLPLYVPCLMIFFLPYDKVYCYIRKKRNRPQRHLSDFTLNIFRSAGVLYLFQMYVLTYDKLAFIMEK